MVYAELSDLEAALPGNPDLGAEGQRMIDAASRALDKLVGIRPGGLEPDDSPTTRTYTATSSGLVVIDDLSADPDEVTSDGDVITDDVTPEPLNAVADGEPYQWLVSDGEFCTDHAKITVTGTFGWPAVPDQVEQWVLVYAARLLKRLREAPFGLVTGAFDGEVVRLARDDPDTELLVGKLSRHRPVVA